MTQFINGPINYAYLEGKINGIEKKIYLFMDEHNKLEEQTRCESFDSIDISQYLYKKIKNTNDELDFFLEIEIYKINKKSTNKKDIYIKDIYIKDTMELFKSEFIIEKINDKDKVRYSKSNPKVRLHYLDIRDFFGIDEIRYKILPQIQNKIILLSDELCDNEKIKISQRISEYLQKIRFLIDKLIKDKDEIIYRTNTNIDIENKSNDMQRYYINKIINGCENNDLKNNLIMFLENNFNKILNDLNKAFDDVKYRLDNIIDIIELKQIKVFVDFIGETSLDLYSLFIDCFLLRRILDKDYIRKTITYTGSQHSINYIYFLVKYYNFKIIKIHHLEYPISELLDKISNTDYVLKIYKFFIKNAKVYPQCIPYEPFFGGNRDI
jgi:hypothetical protein